MIWLTVLLGVFSGFLGGLLGIGGGVVIVPALIILYEVNATHAPGQATVIAIATSLTCIIFTSISAAYAQHRRNMINWQIVQRMVLFFIFGSFTAGLLVPYLPANSIRLIIGVFLAAVAVIMLTAWTPSRRRAFPSALPTAGIGYAGGLVSGTAGIAGGNVIVPTLVFLNVRPHNATATSSAMGVPIAAAGALGYALSGSPLSESISHDWMLGSIDLKAALGIVIGAILAAPLGVAMAHRVNGALLKKLFGLLLIFVAARMIYTGTFT